MGKYVIKKTKTGFFFNLEAVNGQVIGTSEVYSTKAGCKKGIASLQKIATSQIEDLTIKNNVEFKTPKYQVYQDRKKQYRYRLISSNGKIVFTGEGYSAMQACKQGVLSVQSNVNSEIVDTSIEEKKTAAKKTVKKAAPAKKADTKKATAKKDDSKKTDAKKTAVKAKADKTKAKKEEKMPAKKAAAKKTADKKPAAKKETAKKTTTAKKAGAKKTADKK